MPQRWNPTSTLTRTSTVRPARRHCVGPRARDVEVVDDEREVGALEELQHARRVDRADRVGHTDVGEPCRGKHLGLAELGAADADRAAVDLPARDQRALMGLGMRPHADAPPVGGLLHSIDVGHHPRTIDEDGGCRQLGQGHAEIMSRSGPQRHGEALHVRFESDCGRPSVALRIRGRPSRRRFQPHRGDA